LARQNYGSLRYISTTSWAARRPAQDIFGGLGIAAGEFIENAVKGYFGTVATLITAADHALGCGAQVLPDEPDRHLFQGWVKIIRACRNVSGVHVVSEGDQRFLSHDIGTSRTFHRIGCHDVRRKRFLSRFFQKSLEWRDSESITFLAGNQPVLSI